jgi:hypothetical protein
MREAATHALAHRLLQRCGLVVFHSGDATGIRAPLQQRRAIGSAKCLCDSRGARRMRGA